jgi:hypothetical protein
VHAQDVLGGLQLRVSKHQARQVDCQEAAAAELRRNGEYQQAAGHGQQRIESGDQPEAVDQPDEQPSSPYPQQRTDGELHHERDRHRGVELALARGKQLEQRHGEKDRHRVVAARFDLQRRCDALLQRSALRAQQRKHRRGVGRPHDRPEQHPFEPRQLEHPGGEYAEQGRGDEHPYRGEADRRPQGDAEGLAAGAHAAVENDHGERESPDYIGGLEVVESDPARPVLAGEHAEKQEHEQQRRAHARGDVARHDADEQQRRADQDGEVPELHAWKLSESARRP